MEIPNAIGMPGVTTNLVANWAMSRVQALDLSLVDLAFDIAEAEDETLSVETLCFNGNMPEKLPFAVGKPHLNAPPWECPSPTSAH